MDANRQQQKRVLRFAKFAKFSFKKVNPAVEQMNFEQKRVLHFAKFAKFSFKKVTPAFEQMNFVHNYEQSEQNAEQTKFQFQQPVDFFQFLKFFKVLLL